MLRLLRRLRLLRHPCADPRPARARPQRLAGTELVVAVPSGAHAARAKLDAAAILDELHVALGGAPGAPTTLRVVVAPGVTDFAASAAKYTVNDPAMQTICQKFMQRSGQKDHIEKQQVQARGR